MWKRHRRGDDCDGVELKRLDNTSSLNVATEARIWIAIRRQDYKEQRAALNYRTRQKSRLTRAQRSGCEKKETAFTGLRWNAFGATIKDKPVELKMDSLGLIPGIYLPGLRGETFVDDDVLRGVKAMDGRVARLSERDGPYPER